MYSFSLIHYRKQQDADSKKYLDGDEMLRLAIISADELATQLRYVSCRVRRIVIFGDRYLYAYADLRYVSSV